MLDNEEENRPAEELENEATALRQHLAAKSQILEPINLPVWRRAILFTLLVGLISGAVYLLIFEESRKQMLAGLTESWMELYLGRDPDILELPPPPPREVQPRVRYPDTFNSSSSEFDGVLYSSSSGLATRSDDEEGEAEPGFVSPAKTEESQNAFKFLIQDSEIAKKLSDNSLDEYEFKEWKPVRIDPPVFFIDLLVTRKSDSRELHLVWEVDLDNSATRALSQAARDLEVKGKE